MGEDNLLCQKCGAEIKPNEDRFVPMTCPSCSMVQISPFNEGDLHFEKLISANRMFYVYSGYDAKHKLFLHIVYLRKDFKDMEWALAAAKEQASELTRLSHVNICPLFNHGDINGSYYVSSPRLEGYLLSSYNPETHGLMDITRTLEVMQAVALGMAMAHYEQFSHHNMCPVNIHVDDRGMVRVNNFFPSRMIYLYDQRRMRTRKQIYISVPAHFISPEKAESGVEDHRGDVFSFGVMLYYMLTGAYPFEGNGEMDTIYSRIKRKKGKDTQTDDGQKFDYIPPEAPSRRRPDLPEDLSHLVLNLLSYYPNNRPSFSEILNAFNMLRAKSEVVKIRSIQEQIIDTETRDIPKMAPYGRKPKTGDS
ncbi:MAG: protein kinase [Victivallales bacterium]|nr:protein kinase [Victivallales bacterium]